MNVQKTSEKREDVSWDEFFFFLDIDFAASMPLFLVQLVLEQRGQPPA